MLERGSPHVERQAESALRLFDETDNLRHDALEVFVSASEFRLRKAIPQGFDERLGLVAQLNCANSLRRGGHKDGPSEHFATAKRITSPAPPFANALGFRPSPGAQVS